MKDSTRNIIIGTSIFAGVLVLFLATRKKISRYKRDVIKTANEEWARFGYTTLGKDGKYIKKGATEQQEGFYQRVGDYWKSVGKNLDGRDWEVPWSSAFISWVMDKSGGTFGIPWRKSSAHASYIREYIQNRKNGNFNAPFVAYRLNEKPAEVGDLVCYSREGSDDKYDRTSNYKSHCDIVVAVKKGEIEVIGGNVGHSVSKRILPTDENGIVTATNKDWFAIIKNNA
tara:strand:+ start:2059 stop:2742 length:684 start_codon:yes stop_codon:yes gene_type:complete